MKRLRAVPKDWHERAREPGEAVAPRPMHYARAKMLTVKEVADQMRRPASYVLKLIHEKKLWAQPDGRRYLIPEAALSDYFEAERRRKGIA